jgi:hypothetical protein
LHAGHFFSVDFVGGRSGDGFFNCDLSKEKTVSRSMIGRRLFD